MYVQRTKSVEELLEETETIVYEGEEHYIRIEDDNEWADEYLNEHGLNLDYFNNIILENGDEIPFEYVQSRGHIPNNFLLNENGEEVERVERIRGTSSEEAPADD